MNRFVTALPAFGPIELAVARRAAVLWLLIRLVVTGLTRAGGEPALWLHPQASLIVIASVGFLSWLDTKRRHEDILLANLGTSRGMVHALGFGPAAALELVAGVLSRV